jgi:hypothetical protein
MKRVRRWLFNWLAGVSLLLCIGLTLLAIYSFRTADTISKSVWSSQSNSYDTVELKSERGAMTLLNISYPSGSHFFDPPDQNQLGKWRLISESAVRSEDRHWSGLWGFDFISKSWVSSDNFRSILNLTVPYGPLILLSGIVPIVALVRSRPFRQAGHCDHCGYDLRATPERCPECGTVTLRRGAAP